MDNVQKHKSCNVLYLWKALPKHFRTHVPKNVLIVFGQ
jgi:hypothetical protein